MDEDYVDDGIQIEVNDILTNYDAVLSQTNHQLMVTQAELKAWKMECLSWRKKALNAMVQTEPKGD